MLDLTTDLLPRLHTNRIPGLDLGDEFVYPAYLGQSILNIPSTVCDLLDIPGIGAPPLHGDVLETLGSRYQKVIVILMDALALHRFQRWMADGAAPSWARLQPDAMLAPLTSITPSTTSAALTALWTGRSAAEHGITGYEMWMKEYGVVANTIIQSPFTIGEAGSLRKAGFDPISYLPFPTLGMHLANHGIRSHVFQHYSILQSGLSQMFFKEVDAFSFTTATDLWINVRDVIESRADLPGYYYVYWGEIDSFSHRYGPDDERCAAELESFGEAMSRLFLARLSPAARRDTLLVLIADHGQIQTLPDPQYEFRQHPSLSRRLHILPTGEHRLAYFYVRPGQVEAVHEYIQQTWPNSFSVIDSHFAIDAGLFGPGQIHPHLHDRVGDFLILARGDAYLWWSGKDNLLRGRHGGLHPHEMLVPFFALPL